MSGSNTSVILSGSYNGQQSVGDEFLLRSVAAQLRRVVGKDVEFLAYVHAGEESNQEVCREVRLLRGVSPLFWRWFGKLRHLKLPFGPHLVLSLLTIPIYLMMSSKSRAEIGEIWRRISKSGLFYFFGGTQLSRQWFWLNWPPLIMMLVLCRVSGVSVYFGPQQYGPQTRLQRTLLRLTLKGLARAFRVRNDRCLALVGCVGPSMHDEVFSCTAVHPIVRGSSKQGRFLLLNVRGDNFDADGSGVEFDVIAALLTAVTDKLGMPIRVFEMSGEKFCDDQAFLGYLRDHHRSLDIELWDWEDETRFFQLVADSYGTLSMSFHGCLLSIMGGCPAVPMVSGCYYEYKYADFDKYTGHQGVPILRLSDLDVVRAAERTLDFFERYDPVKAAKAREAASRQMSEWYQVIGQGFARRTRERISGTVAKPT